MSDGYRVDPAALRNASAALGSDAQRLSQLVQSLSGTVTSGSPWGNDEAGTMFSSAYTGVLGLALEAFQTHVDQLLQASDGLQIWATTKVDVDQQVSDSFRSLGP